MVQTDPATGRAAVTHYQRGALGDNREEPTIV